MNDGAASLNKKFGAVLIIAAVFLIAYEVLNTSPSTLPPQNNRTNPTQRENDPQRILDAHLKETQQRLQLQKDEIELRKRLDDTQNFEEHPSRTHLEREPVPLELNTTDEAEKLAQDLKKNPIGSKRPSSPEEYLQMELFKAQEAATLNAAYKEEYARQFIANARKDGWEIKLNKDFKVISVKPLR
jgi:hypothetical protein